MAIPSLTFSEAQEQIEQRLLTPNATCHRCDGGGVFSGWDNVGHHTDYMVRRFFKCPCASVCRADEVQARLTGVNVPDWFKETLAQLWLQPPDKTAEEARLLWRIMLSRAKIEAEVYRAAHDHYPGAVCALEDAPARG